MSIETDTVLRLTRVIAADRDTVFRAWTDPAQLRQWSCPEDAVVEDAQVDLSVGGTFRIRMRGKVAAEHCAFGTYREIERPSRLVYTWDWDEPDLAVGETLVTVEFNDLGNSTEVVLTHERFPAAEATEGHRQGWASCLNRLEALFA